MTCHEIEERLSAYLDDALPAEERKRLEEHLTACPSCARSLADLRKTVGLVRDLEEVEPPPWLKQKIMNRVREEAAPKRGILRALFFPLHIKVPVQAFALILVAVLAFQVYRTGEPERQALDLPVPPARVLEKTDAPGTARQAVEPAPEPERMRDGLQPGQSPRPVPLAGRGPSPLSPASREKGSAFAPPPGRTTATLPGDGAAVPESVSKAEGGRSPFATPPGRSAQARPTVDAAPPAGGADSREAERAPPSVAYEAKRKDLREPSSLAAKEEKATVQAAREDGAVTGATRMAAAPAPVVEMVLRVRDIATAAAVAERELRASGAGNIRRRDRSEGILVSADIPGGSLPGLVRRLRPLGELRAPDAHAYATEAARAVRIRIVSAGD